jgi:hypothetical protein
MTGTPIYPTIRSEADAEALCAQIEERLNVVEAVIREETDLLARSSLEEAFALQERKAHAGQAYMHGLEGLKHNSVALARFRPSGLERIRMRQGRFLSELEANLRILQTLRSVSENLLRGVAHEVMAPKTLSTYGGTGTMTRQKQTAVTPSLLISKRS